MGDEPDPIDRLVGARIRDRRKGMGISQQHLGRELGLTFQQVQKYERGVNRVSASKLYQIAHVLKTRPSFFFENVADPQSEAAYLVAEPSNAAFVSHLTSSAETSQVMQLVARLPADRRKLVLELVRALTGSGVEA